MKVNVKTINPTLVIDIDGSEAWLKNIYRDYFSPDDSNHEKLSGSIKLQLNRDAGTFLVTGNIKFIPELPCGRCGGGINWPLNFDLNMLYHPETTNTLEIEMNLNSADLDSYYVTNKQIDLEQLLVDTINELLPYRALHESADGNSCSDASKDPAQEKVWSSQEEAPSPFAKLKGLKLPN